MPSIFSKIMSGEIKGTLLHEDAECLAMVDINAQAPKHILIVPRRALRSLADAAPADAALLGHLLVVAGEVARKQGLAESGYRVVINTGRDGGQTVDHLHVHLLGGRSLSWPPG